MKMRCTHESEIKVADLAVGVKNLEARNVIFILLILPSQHISLIERFIPIMQPWRIVSSPNFVYRGSLS